MIDNIIEAEIITNNGGSKMGMGIEDQIYGNEKKPWVLINAPITSYKLGVVGAYVAGIKAIDYANYAVLLTDNSETDDMYVSLKPVEKMFERDLGKKFKVVMTPHRVYVRERLVEGRNLARSVLTKQKDLSGFKLSKTDELKVRELQGMNFDYVFTLEQDVIPPKDVINKLLEAKKDAVSGIYVNTKAYKDANTGAQSVSFIPMVWFWANNNVREAEILVDSAIEQLWPSRIEECAATGVGCGLVKAEVWKGIYHDEEYSMKYEKAVENYLIENPEATVLQVETALQTMEDGFLKEVEINTRGGDLILKREPFFYSIKEEQRQIELVTSLRTFGFRYDQRKFACDDMFFSLDLHNAGYTLWFDSHVWCTHLHQMWDTVVMGER